MKSLKALLAVCVLPVVIAGCQPESSSGPLVDSSPAEHLPQGQVNQALAMLYSSNPGQQSKGLDFLKQHPVLLEQHQQAVQELASQGDSAVIRRKAQELLETVNPTQAPTE